MGERKEEGEKEMRKESKATCMKEIQL